MPLKPQQVFKKERIDRLCLEIDLELLRFEFSNLMPKSLQIVSIDAPANFVSSDLPLIKEKYLKQGWKDVSLIYYQEESKKKLHLRT